MQIIVVLSGIQPNADPDGQEQVLCDSDLHVLAKGIRLREAHGGRVYAITIGSDDCYSKALLQKAYTYGVDRAYAVSVPAACSADPTWRTAILAETIRQDLSPFDLLLFGRLAQEGDGVTVAAMTAVRLQIPRILYCSDLQIAGEQLHCRKYLAPGEEAVLRCGMPALVQSIETRGVHCQAKIADIIHAYTDARLYWLRPDPAVCDAVRPRNGVTPAGTVQPIGWEKPALQVLPGDTDRAQAVSLIEILREMGFTPYPAAAHGEQ